MDTTPAKAITALVLMVVTEVVKAIIGVYDDGITGSEWLAIALQTLVVAGGVFQVPNRPTGLDRSA